MKKKYFSILILIVLAFQMRAQSNFSIKVTQVYPQGGLVYGNTYNLSSEFENAKKNLRSQYTGKNANYIMELTKPGGKETKPIQNLKWILVTNGKKEYKDKQTYGDSYPQVTIIKIYACNNDGSINSGSKDNAVIEYDHYYKFYIDNKEQNIESESDKQSYYRPVEKCKEAAKSYYEKNKPKIDSIFCEVKIFKDKNLVDSINNRNEYNNFIATEIQKPTLTNNNETDTQKVSCKETANQYEKRGEDFNAIINCINIDSIYSKKNIDDNLKLCKDATTYMEKKDRTQIKNITDKLKEIFKKMREKDPFFDFSWDDFFKVGKTDSGKITKGIEKLIEINKKIK